MTKLEKPIQLTEIPIFIGMADGACRDKSVIATKIWI